jgi:ribosomal protein S18 acetylase RimI-like enzyme
LCFVDGEAAGLVNSFEGFSTFKAKPLINIHDVTVRGTFRGLGLSRKMIAVVEEEARRRDCCKLTLEVLEGNTHAADAYRRFGFGEPEAAAELGRTFFMNKPL